MRRIFISCWPAQLPWWFARFPQRKEARRSLAARRCGGIVNHYSSPLSAIVERITTFLNPTKNLHIFISLKRPCAILSSKKKHRNAKNIEKVKISRLFHLHVLCPCMNVWMGMSIYWRYFGCLAFQDMLTKAKAGYLDDNEENNDNDRENTCSG